jgi:hypothetical protein
MIEREKQRVKKEPKQCARVCVCECVSEREKKRVRERERKRENGALVFLASTTLSLGIRPDRKYVGRIEYFVIPTDNRHQGH